MSDLAYRSLQIVAALCLLNFAAFLAISSGIGGDALNGKIVDGHFYLRDHGHFTEVTKAVFDYSRWHAQSLFVTHPLGILLLFIGGREHKRRNPEIYTALGK
jgi:hypothetical protein